MWDTNTLFGTDAVGSIRSIGIFRVFSSWPSLTLLVYISNLIAMAHGLQPNNFLLLVMPGATIVASLLLVAMPRSY